MTDITTEQAKKIFAAAVAPLSARIAKFEEQRTMTPAQIDVLKRMPTAVRALAASAAPGATISVAELDETLKTENLPVDQRIAIKNDLSRAGILASTDRRISNQARL